MTGVYKITNTHNWKYYIGSSVDIHLRWKKHLARLRNNNHENAYLQNAYNKYGEEAFELSILEECSREQQYIREQYYITNLQAIKKKIGYNLSPSAKGGHACSLSEELQNEIVQMTNDGIGSRVISKTLNVPRTTVRHYRKFLNTPTQCENPYDKRYSDEVINKIRQLSQDGLSCADIARKLNLNRRTVNNYRLKMGFRVNTC